MRKIEELARTAFYYGYNFKRSNTEVKVSEDSVNYYLHGNLIAKKESKYWHYIHDPFGMEHRNNKEPTTFFRC